MKNKVLENRRKHQDQAIEKARILVEEDGTIIYVHEHAVGHFTVNENKRLGTVNAGVKVLVSGDLRFFCQATNGYVSVPN